MYSKIHLNCSRTIGTPCVFFIPTSIIYIKIITFLLNSAKNQDQTNLTIVRLTTQKLTKVVIFCPRPTCMFKEHFFKSGSP